MQQFIMASRNSNLADGAASRPLVGTLSGRGPMALQFDAVCGNEPTPQIMIQLIGCRIEVAAQLNGLKHLKAST